MIVSYSIHAYESHEYISRLDPTVPLNIDLYQAILDLKDHYKEIEGLGFVGISLLPTIILLLHLNF